MLQFTRERFLVSNESTSGQDCDRESLLCIKLSSARFCQRERKNACGLANRFDQIGLTTYLECERARKHVAFEKLYCSANDNKVILLFNFSLLENGNEIKQNVLHSFPFKYGRTYFRCDKKTIKISPSRIRWSELKLNLR